MRVGTKTLTARPTLEGVRLHLAAYGLTLGDELLSSEQVGKLVGELEDALFDHFELRAAAQTRAAVDGG